MDILRWGGALLRYHTLFHYLFTASLLHSKSHERRDFFVFVTAVSPEPGIMPDT